MRPVLVTFLTSLPSCFRSRRALQPKTLLLRHELAVYQRGGPRPRLHTPDRGLRAWLAQTWSDWQDALVVVQPRTVIAWRRRRFREHWTRLRRHATAGRPRLAEE